MAKCICQNCGAVNLVEPEPGEDWLECLLPQGFEWSLPAGKLSPAVGAPIYVDAHGNHLSREAYLVKYNIDPEIAYQNMRGKNPQKPVELGLDLLNHLLQVVKH